MKKFYNLQKKKLRMASLTHPGRKEVLDGCKVKVKVGLYKNGKDKFLIYYKCATCSKEFRPKEVDVDHIIEVDVLYNEYYICFSNQLLNISLHQLVIMALSAAIFCPTSNLQVLCKPCHKIKTGKFQELRRWSQSL